jgi:hypothetical protein
MRKDVPRREHPIRERGDREPDDACDRPTDNWRIDRLFDPRA